MIEKTGSNTISSMPSSAFLDAESMAALALHEDAKQSRAMAREMRKDAQKERLELMHQAADKLREMAGNAMASAIWQGAAGLASAGCSAAGISGGQAWGVAGKVVDVVGRVDPFEIQSKFLAVDKQELETRAEAAGNQAQEQGDFESEARRISESATQLLQKANDAAHAVRMAALRG